MRFWFSMLIRLTFIAAGFYCLYAALTDKPLTGFVWVGAACGFLACCVLERHAQIDRGEVEP